MQGLGEGVQDVHRLLSSPGGGDKLGAQGLVVEEQVREKLALSRALDGGVHHVQRTGVRRDEACQNFLLPVFIADHISAGQVLQVRGQVISERQQPLLHLFVRQVSANQGFAVVDTTMQTGDGLDQRQRRTFSFLYLRGKSSKVRKLRRGGKRRELLAQVQTILLCHLLVGDTQYFEGGCFSGLLRLVVRRNAFRGELGELDQVPVRFPIDAQEPVTLLAVSEHLVENVLSTPRPDYRVAYKRSQLLFKLTALFFGRSPVVSLDQLSEGIQVQHGLQLLGHALRHTNIAGGELPNS